jgi:hypothetical protein
MATTLTTPAAEMVARVDALVSGLFDVSDDIAEAVVWLAENWSAVLPAPEWAGRLVDQFDPGRAVLRLRAYCSPDQLERIAALAETTTVLDRTRPGRRRRVCTRSFGTGRVELWAYAYEREPVR